MVFKHGIAATLSVAALGAMAGYLSSANMDLSRELAEIKVLGNTSVVRVAGLENCVFTADGFFDATADAAIYTSFHGAASVAVVFQPDGVTNYTVSCWIGSYSVKASTGGATTYTLNLSSNGNCVRT